MERRLASVAHQYCCKRRSGPSPVGWWRADELSCSHLHCPWPGLPPIQSVRTGRQPSTAREAPGASPTPLHRLLISGEDVLIFLVGTSIFPRLCSFDLLDNNQVM